MKPRSTAVVVTAPVVRALAATLAAAALLPAGLAGQELRGRVVVEGAVDQPVEGAVVTLLGPADETIDAAFTSPTGTFAVRADSAGEYRVRIDRIGYARWHSEAFRLDPAAPTIVELEIPIEPVRLADLDVEVYRGCEADPTRAREVELVWDEARKALEAALLAQRLQLFRYDSVIFDRALTRARLLITDVETAAASGVSEAPFRSLSAEDLSDDGYIQEEGATVYYYAPDATVLLSDQFLGEHCFGLDRDEIEDRPVVGLTFEPREGRTLPDISGVLWLDEETAELERVEFRYENIPYRGVDDERIAGVVEYGRLPTGAFIVQDWFIRMPDLAAGRSRYYIDRFREYGAELRDVSLPDGGPVDWREGAGIRGRIVNSLTGEPLRDATLYLDRPRGDDLVRHTGPNGEYSYDRLPSGEYSLRFTHPVMRTIDWDGTHAEVRLAEGERTEVDFALPPPEFVLRRLCGDDADGTAVVAGRVRDLGRELAIEQGVSFRDGPIRVWAEWTQPRRGTEPGENRGREVVRSDGTRADIGGTFALCNLPIGMDMVVQVVASDGRAAARSLRTAFLVTIADIVLEPDR